LGFEIWITERCSFARRKEIRCATFVETERFLIDISRFSNFNKLLWIIAGIIAIARCKTLKGGNTSNITPQLFQDAENFLTKMIQKGLDEEMQKKDTKGRSGGRYKSLKPVRNKGGYYVVGQRLNAKNPMITDASLQRSLPTNHQLTRLLMDRAHKECGHRGRDATLAGFRQKYWIAQGRKIVSNSAMSNSQNKR
jgi:hypothetical protein